MSKYSQVNNQGTSILGVLLALGVFAIMSSAIVSLTMGSFQGIIRSDQWITANSLALEGYEGARSVRDRAWNELKYNQSAISTSTMGWALTGEGTSEQSDIYSRTINFSDVCRASSSEIVVCPNGYKDVHSKKIDVNVSWPIAGIGGATTSAKYSSYLTNWEGHDWISTNWTGGAGQAIWADSTKYSTDDNNIYHADTGEIKLYKDYQGGGWFPSGGLEVTDTKETDFNQGTYSGTAVIRTGTPASVVLSQTNYMWSPHTDSQVATNQTINDISSISASDIWAVGNAGKILHYNGTNWSENVTIGSANLNALEMISATNGWAVGNGGSVYQYNGSAWANSLNFPEVKDDLYSEFSAGTFSNTLATSSVNGEVILNKQLAWGVDMNSGGVTAQSFRAISVVAENNIWAVSTNGEIFNYNGSIWARITDQGTDNVYDINMLSTTNGWAVGASSKFYHYDGVSWTLVNDLGNNNIYGLSMIDASNGWASGDSGKFYHYNGIAWSEFVDTGNARIYDIQMMSTASGWAVADSGRIYKYNGTSWSLFVDTGNQTWNSLEMLSASDGWIVGSSGFIYHYNGTTWSQFVDTGNEDWYGIDMYSANLGYIVGSSGSIRKFNGTAWNVEASPLTSIIRSVAVVNSTKIWVMGDTGSIGMYGNIYYPTGTFTSHVFDTVVAGAVWGRAFWSESLPSGADLTIAVRSGATASPDGTWSAWTTELTNNAGSLITARTGRYVQYRATLTRGINLNNTPYLADITLKYNESVSADLNDISIVASNDYWIVGAGGYIGHYNGSSITQASSPVTENLNAIDMVTSTSGWAAGASGKILRYNAGTWTQFVDTGTMNWNSIRMVSATDGWVVGDGGFIYHYNGTNWTQYADTGAQVWNDIDMVSPTLGWVVGSIGEIYTFNGSNWTATTSPTTESLNTVDSVAVNQGFIGGANGMILDYALDYGYTGTFLSRVFDGGATAPAWSLLYWQESLPTNTNITISTRAGSSATAGGAGWTAWSAEMTVSSSSPIASNQQNLRYLQYRATLTRTAGSITTPELAYLTITYAGATNFVLNDISMLNANYGWAVGNTGRIVKYDGTSWTAFANMGGSNVLGVDAVSTSSAWAVGQGGEVWHYNGTAWSLYVNTGGDTWYGIDMLSDTNGWMVGNSGKIWHFNGTTWSLSIDMGANAIRHIQMLSATDGWASGDSGRIYHYNGTVWSQFVDTGNTDWYSIYMLSSTSGWVVGTGGAIYRFNGTVWLAVTSPTGQQLNGVYALSADDAVAVGNSGTILSWDGVVWTITANTATDNLTAVDMSLPLQGWVVGVKGVVSIYRGARHAVPPFGVLTSSIFQMSTSTNAVQIIEWDQFIPPACSPITACAVKLEVRVAPDNVGVPGIWSAWYGSTGPGTYFTENRGTLIPDVLNWNTWVQYRVTLTSDEVETPIVYEIRLNYK